MEKPVASLARSGARQQTRNSLSSPGGRAAAPYHAAGQDDPQRGCRPWRVCAQQSTHCARSKSCPPPLAQRPVLQRDHVQADLPFGVEIPSNLLFGRLGGHFGPGRARLADHLHTIGHVHCTCGMRAVHAYLACPHVPTGRFIAYTAHTFKTVATLRAQGVHLVLAIGASGDVPVQFVATQHTRVAQTLGRRRTTWM